MPGSKKHDGQRSPSVNRPPQEDPVTSSAVTRQDVKEPVTPAPPSRDERDTAFYGAVVNAWIGTRMEKDKSILTLSAAGDGLLVTLLTTVGTNSWIEAIFYALAFAGFTYSAWTAVRIFDRNADYLARLANDDDEPDPRLGKLDRALLRSFLFGVAFSVLIAVSSAVTQYFPDRLQASNDAPGQQAQPQYHLQPAVDSPRVEQSTSRRGSP